MSFRQPVLRAARERLGETFRFTYETNPGEVWEEDEFWIELSWRIDPDGALGIRRWFESPYRAGREADRPGVLPLDLRERRPGSARGGRPRRSRSPRLHAPLRRVPHRERRRSEKHAQEVDVPADAVRDPETGRVDVGGRPVGIEIDGARGGRVPHAVAAPRDLLAHAARSGAGRKKRCPATFAATSIATPWTRPGARCSSSRPSACPR